MGEDLLYSRLSPWGKSYYIASFPGRKATMGERLLYNTGFAVLMESALRYDNESIFFLQNEYK
jgi:hypothetical protein